MLLEMSQVNGSVLKMFQKLLLHPTGFIGPIYQPNLRDPIGHLGLSHQTIFTLVGDVNYFQKIIIHLK